MRDLIMFLLGALVGSAVGIFMLCLCMAAKIGDRK